MGYNLIFERMKMFHNTSFGFLLRGIDVVEKCWYIEKTSELVLE